MEVFGVAIVPVIQAAEPLGPRAPVLRLDLFRWPTLAIAPCDLVAFG
jgi:hypothetical protein